MGLTDYRFNPNSFSAVRVAVLTIATFASPDADRMGLLKWCSEYLAPFEVAAQQPGSITKADLKDLKKKGLKEIQNLIKTGTGRYSDLLKLEPDRARAINIAMTLARWPEWFIHPESYLTEVAEHLWDHRDEINAITYYEPDADGNMQRICPYDPKIPVDPMHLYDTMRDQAPAIEEFCHRENINSAITVEDVIGVLEDIKRECEYPGYHDLFEQGFFKSIENIRGHAADIRTAMRMYKAGKATSSMFGRSESRSVLSDDVAIMHMLKTCGWPKNSCPNVLSNIFSTQLSAVALKPQPGQIPIDRNFEYFDTAPGLGPALKIRYVYNLLMEYQNYLSFLADLIKRSDEQYDSIQESYTNQMKGLRAELPSIIDAYCIDATGYSDYLFRGVYTYLLHLYRLPQDIIQDIMNIFSLPIKVGDHICPVLFGAMQGCKLLVFVMNHANRLIGIIARRLSKQKVELRHNAGDDTITLSTSQMISQETIHNEMKVFAIFNCAINPLKTAHLASDGYCDFCSKYFMRASGSDPGLVSIMGLPPKLIGKDMPSIKSFTEIFRVLDLCFTVRNPIDHVWCICRPMLSSELESGCRLPNALDRQYTLDEKIQLAKNVSYKLGGLAEEGEITVEQTAKHALIILERMILKYRFKVIGIFRVVQGIIPEDTELYKALGSVEHLGLGRILTAVADLRAAIESGIMEQQKLDDCCRLISQLDRCIVKGISISATSSTYHRLTATRDIDSLLEPDAEPNFEIIDKLSTPSDMLELALMAAISSETYCDIDQIRKYMSAKEIIHKFHNRFYQEYFGGYPNYYVEDDDGKSVKLTTKDRNVGCNRQNRYKPISDMVNPELQFVSNLLQGDKQVLRALLALEHDMGASALMDYLHLIVSDISKSMEMRFRTASREYEAELLKRKITQDAKRFLNEDHRA